MAGALESSITLDDVFAMVGNKRVPLAPELAGYLALEIAEGADEAGGDVDPRSVYIAEEGTVALVKRRDAPSGDAEGSIRVMLGRLLDSSGSTTAALTSAAKRRSTGSLRALSEELEAALIPVNRAAGRRALARLAREVKRVTMRVGRSSGSGASAAIPSSRPPPPPVAMPEEAPTARREALPDLVQRTVPSARGAAPARPAPVEVEVIEPAAASPERPPEATTARPPPRGLEHSAADVDSLLAEFARASQRPDQLVARDLKAMAGLDPTPPPPGTASAAPPQEPLSNAPSDAGVEALLAMSDPTVDPPRAAAPHTPLGPPFQPRAKAAPLPSASEPERPPKPRVSSRPPATPAQAPSSKRVAAARAL